MKRTFTLPMTAVICVMASITASNALTADIAHPKLTLEQKVDRLNAVNDVNNLMGSYSFLSTGNKFAEVVNLFALKTPGVRAEIFWGAYNGPEGIKRLFTGFIANANGDGIGRLLVHTMTTPIIVVAGDGKTAKGVWVSPGFETMPLGAGQPEAKWSWIKYAADFIREEGAWKIWHLRAYGLFSARPGETWANNSFDREAMINFGKNLPEQFRADSPPTTPLWKYRLDVAAELVPDIPRPYQTFDPKTAY